MVPGKDVAGNQLTKYRDEQIEERVCVIWLSLELSNLNH